METLTESNALFTYLERCRNASQSYIIMKKKHTTLDEDIIAQCCAEVYQVEIVDMLAETNTQWR